MSEQAGVNTRYIELQALIRDCHKMLINYAYNLTGNRADAHDIAQESYARLYEYYKGGRRPVVHLKGLLFTIARNVARDSQRTHVVRETFNREEVSRERDQSPSPEHIWLAREEYSQLQAAITRLPPKTQLALRLVREQGRAYEEVGKQLGIKTHSARRLVERAMEQLQDVSEQRGPEAAQALLAHSDVKTTLGNYIQPRGIKPKRGRPAR